MHLLSSNSEIEYDDDGNMIDLGKKDRIIPIRTAIPSAPVIAILENAARMFIGVEGGIVSMPAVTTPDMYRCYWHQMSRKVRKNGFKNGQTQEGLLAGPGLWLGNADATHQFFSRI